MPIALVLVLLGIAGPTVAQPPASVNASGPKVTASFRYADANERCASLLYVTYSYSNAPAKLIWTMVVQTADSKQPDGIKPEPFVDHGTGPVNKSTTVTIPANSPTDQAAAGLTETRYAKGYYIPQSVSLASLQATRPCRRAMQMQVRPH
jgi:hypothetical protein